MEKQGVFLPGFRKQMHLRITIIASLLAIAAFGSSVLLIAPPIAHAQTSLVISGDTPTALQLFARITTTRLSGRALDRQGFRHPPSSRAPWHAHIRQNH